MKKDIIKFLCDLEGYKTAVKNCHFSADSMSEHKLMDEIADTIASNQDEIGEICQGIHGQFNKTTIKGNEYKLSTSKKFINDVINSINEFYKKIQGENYVGLRSVVETFIGDMNKYVYLLNLCLKEDFKRSYKNKINEEKNNIALNELDSEKYGYVRGFHAAQPRYNQKQNSVSNKARHDRMVNMAGDAHWKNMQNAGLGSKEAQEMYDKNKKGYGAGYQRGMKSESVKLTEKELNECIDEAIRTVMTNFINEIGDGSGKYNLVKGMGAVAGRAYNRYGKVQNKMGVNAAYKKYGPTFQVASEKERQVAPNQTDDYNDGFKYGMQKESIENEAEVQGGMYNDKELNYTHFAVNKITNLIVDGWDYSGYDSEELKQYKNDYFNDDLKNNGFNPKFYKILSFKGCQKQGLDPNNKQVWSNTGVYPLAQEVQMNKKGQNPYETAQQEHPDWFLEN